MLIAFISITTDQFRFSAVHLEKKHTTLKITPSSKQAKATIPLSTTSRVEQPALSANFKILAGLSGDEISSLSSFLETIHCIFDEIQLLEKSESPSLYFVSQGSLKVAIRNRYQEYDRVFEARAGESILEKSLLDAAPVTTIVKAIEPSRLYKLTKDAFDQFCAKHPEAGHRLVENASRISQKHARFPEKVAALYQSLATAAAVDSAVSQKAQLMLGAVKTALCADVCALIDFQRFKASGDPDCPKEIKELVESLLFEQSGLASEARANAGARTVAEASSLCGSEKAILKKFPYALAMPLHKGDNHDHVLLAFSESPFEGTDTRLLEAVTDQILLILDGAHLSEQIDDLVASHAESLRRANHQKSSFISHLSHEIRNPLSSIIGTIDYLNLYQKEDLGEVGSMLQRIDRSAKHVLDILNEALDYSKAESGKLVVHREWTNFNELITEVHDIILGYVQKLDKTSLTIDFGTLYNLPSVYVDYTKIKQVLINLLTNAVKFTAKGHIKLYSWIENNELVMAIEDTGMGIKEQDKEKVFEAFELGHDGSESNPWGAGLGMSISKNIIELHGGKIWFDSTLGEGSTFFISIPLIPPKN